jgi:CHAD domain-containing protein
MAKPVPIVGIDCAAAAKEGIRLVLNTRFEEMCSLRGAALDWNDPEGVHDMRVASRRLRSALRGFLPYLRKRPLTPCLREIKKAADALGRVRDQDVAVRALEELEQTVPPTMVPGIEKFAGLRRQKRVHARTELLQVLDADRLSQLRLSFADSVEAAMALEGPRRSKGGILHPGLVSYREVARTTIRNLLQDLERLSDSLYYPLKIVPLHRMRIAAKRLRYAIELFEYCWGQQLALFAGKVADLQSSLGELHDCDMWIESFGDDLSRPQRYTATDEEKTIQDDSGAAAVWLLGHFVKLRSKHFRDALSLWREWQANDFSTQLRKTILAELRISSYDPKASDLQMSSAATKQ